MFENDSDGRTWLKIAAAGQSNAAMGKAANVSDERYSIRTVKEPSKVNKKVPQALSNLIMHLLAKNPEDRPQSAQEVAEALAQLTAKDTAQMPAKAGKTALFQKPRPTVSRRKWALVGGGVLGLAVLGLVAFFLTSRERQRPENGSTRAEALSPTFTNGLGMEFVLVPKGKSWLGGGGGKPGDKEVEITDDFYLGKYEVTQEEWEKVTGKNPSAFQAVAGIPKEDQKRFPVEQVSWDDTQLFLAELNQRGKQAGWVYRLPKDAEWEYACRGGPRSDKLDAGFDFYFAKPGPQLDAAQANFEHGKGLKRSCKVGSYQPNKLGLFDMHGNVWELCDEGVRPEPGSHRLIRGGSWRYVSEFCRAAHRDEATPSGRDNAIGLRLARVPVGKEIVKIIAPEERKAAEGAKQPPAFKNSLGMEFVLVPKGRFLMGVGGETGAKEVTIGHDFYLGKYEVTQWEWAATTGQNPSTFSRQVKGVEDADLKRFPVESVSWDDTQFFLKQVNERAKEPGWVYRLPKEAEWEYACRGGPVSNKLDHGFDYYLDKPSTTLLPSQANYRLEQGKSLARTCKVGSYQPNRLGLYDMHGNVWEWCDDVEKAADGASLRVLRGGSWLYSSWECRAASRLANPSSHRHNCIGLRLARVPVGKESK